MQNTELPWFGHINRMGERLPQKSLRQELIVEGPEEGSESLGRTT